MGDVEAARAQAKKYIEQAPSSTSAYLNLISCQAEGGRYDLVVKLAKEALRFSVYSEDASYVYYRLAYAFWQTGCLNEALACYLQVPEASPMGSAATIEYAELVREMGNEAPGPEWDPKGCLHTAGVPLAPCDEAMEVVAQALIGLCDAGLPCAAAPLASLVASARHDDILYNVAASLHQGV